MMKTYLVGGAVRDELLGLPVHDFDYLIVGATLQQLEGRFGPTVGSDFPVFLDKATGDQYAMARRERKIGSGYHGFSCDFGPEVTAEEDLSRRDLTINSMARDIETGEILDPFGGQDDLRNKVLRHTTIAFKEDPLRVVRLARFFARYADFTVASETMTLVNEVVNGPEMAAIPSERYWQELAKALTEERVDRFFQFIACLESRIPFFEHVFGPFMHEDKLHSMRLVWNALQTLSDPADRLDVFVAIFAEFDTQMPSGASGKISKLLSNFTKLRWPRVVSADVIYDVLNSSRSWHKGQGEDLALLLSTLRVAQAAGIAISTTATILERCAEAAKAVHSSSFSHLKGTEIGRAMEAARKEAIKDALVNHARERASITASSL